MAEKFVEMQPAYYDRAKIWWMWDFEESRWLMVDETDIMNSLDECLDSAAFTVRSKEKNEILESLKRVGRRNKPKDFPKTWVQFRNKIIDLKSDEEITPTPEYFCTNPIPWEIGEDTDTPTIDRIFTEWVGEENSTILKEIAAYCLLQDYPIHRIFALIGAGSNGKGKYLELIKRFVGRENVISSSLERMVNSRFEIGKMYKKLVCVMGETNSKLLQRTDFLKRATGGDMLPGEFKGKTPFDFFNYSKIIIASNSLPPTTDKTVGFYRRWAIIEWPNQFSEDKDILDDIPDEEYRNFALCCVNILKNIIKTRKFTNQDDINERMMKYEEKSNPVILIINQRYVRDMNKVIPFSEFYDVLNEHLENNRLRKMSAIEVGKIIRAEGLEIKTKTIDGKNCKYVIGIGELPKLPKLSCSHSISTCKNIYGILDNSGNSGNSDGFLKEWREGKYDEILTKETIIEKINKKGMDNMLKMGLIYEPTPGRFKLI